MTSPDPSPAPQPSQPTSQNQDGQLSAVRGLQQTWTSAVQLHEYVFARGKHARAQIEAIMSPSTMWATKITLGGAIGGFVSGFYLGGRHRAMQFLAENAHRLPKTVGGWFFYHRYKNYEMTHAGFKEGFRYGFKFAAVSGAFCCLENAFEQATGREGWINSLAAGTVTSLGFSAAARLSLQYTKYAILFGAGSSLGIGLVQDGYAFVYGTSIKDPLRARDDAFWIPGLAQIKQAAGI
ncbi:uncharacterized protein BJ171DRAFT_595482 [Polychytrium aggregatum]|uniref:uncharacterized protein n=1 Tax=Polychytrium aggregatum TaxID=110093 RepID=UPI0022FF3E80|nr:uncharacterized protein BJ171DRAFT_595482 [Polychytrium aggregatum]KAI9209064.1 hypothetical protein BJ171DRAFT_595482 [Polychytrium aggregatum]